MKKVSMLLLVVFLGILLLNSTLYASDNKLTNKMEDNKPKLQRVTQSGPVFTTTISDPVAIEDFIQEVNLKAIDEIDGDLTSQITFEATEYEQEVLGKPEEERQLGEYPITFSVKDQSNNTAECVLVLNVIDDQAPVLDEENSILKYVFKVGEESMTIEEIIANIKVTDNHSLSHEVVTDEYTGNEGVCGGYPVSLAYVDDSGNFVHVHVNIQVVDVVAPVITSDVQSVSVSYNKPKTVTEILDGCAIAVTDNYATNLTYSIFADNYTDNQTQIGVYEVQVKAVDYSGNEGFLTIQVTVIDDVAPIFYLNETIVSTTTTTYLTNEDYRAILMKRHLVRGEDFTVEVLEDEYVNQKERVGRYEVGLKVTYDDESVQYQKIIVEVVQPAAKGDSVFANIWAWIKKIFQMIWNIVSWPFEQLFGLF